MLTKQQVDILSDKQLFELQKEIDQKLNHKLYETQEKIKTRWESGDEWMIPKEVSLTLSKVSKGYNYKGFPYQVTDYPSKLDRDSKFSFRIIVWYGNFFSANLILSRPYINHFLDKILSIREPDTFLLIAQDIWDSDTSDKEKLALTEENNSKIKSFINRAEPIRLFKQFNMKQINKMDDLLIECFVHWLKK